MRHPTISVVIPVYNAEHTLPGCLDSVFSSDYTDFEVVIVDDGSTDGSVRVARRYPCRIFKLSRNSGPAYARNVGISKARGSIFLFIDADVTIQHDAMRRLHQRFTDPTIDAVIGLRSKRPLNEGLTPTYWALYKYYLWTKTSDVYQTSFTTNRGAVRRSALDRIGLFDKRYRKADVEDYEFGYRLSAQGHRIYVDRSILTNHHHPTFRASVKKFTRRSYQWMRLFVRRRRFDRIYTTSGMGVKVAIGFMAFVLGVVSFLSLWLGIVALLFFAAYIAINLGFYRFVCGERPILLLPIMLLDFFFSVLIALGAVASLLMLPFALSGTDSS